jgi:hypothetical protein
MNAIRALVLGAALFLAAASTVGNARAQGAGSSEALVAARELVTLTSAVTVTKIVAELTGRNWPRIEASLKEKNSKIDAATLAELRKEFEKLQIATTLEVMKDAAPIYARHFTVKELRDLIAFHRTPTGKKALIAMPEASMELLAGLPPRLQLLAQSTNRKFEEILKQRGVTP